MTTDQDRLDRLNVLFKMHDLKLRAFFCVPGSGRGNRRPTDHLGLEINVNVKWWRTEKAIRTFSSVAKLEKYSHGLIKQSVRDFAGFQKRVSS